MRLVYFGSSDFGLPTLRRLVLEHDVSLVVTQPDRRSVGRPKSDELKEEGCLSIPGINIELRRPQAATVNAQDLAGQPFELSDDDVLARVWQHELDHLDGILIIDRMSPMDRLATRKILKELEATAAGA